MSWQNNNEVAQADQEVGILRDLQKFCSDSVATGFSLRIGGKMPPIR